MEEINRKNALVTLLNEISKTDSPQINPGATLQLILDEICHYTKWPVGHVYLVDPVERNALIPTRIWYMENPVRFAPFYNATQSLDFTSNVKLPGTAWVAGKPVWMRDITLHRDFVRAEAAKKCGLHSGYGFPVFEESRIQGVLEFYTTKIEQFDAVVVNAITGITGQLGALLAHSLVGQL